MCADCTDAAQETGATNADGAEKIHPFEARGLGRAPFRFVGMVKQDLCYGEAILNRAECERTGISLTTKPGGTCEYCGTYILRMFSVRSADGREFKVGSDCILKCGQVSLIAAVRRAVNAQARARKAKAAKDMTAELSALLADASVRAKLEGKPHPHASMAAEGSTLADWADWMAENAGAAGRARAARAVKTAAGL